MKFRLLLLALIISVGGCQTAGVKEQRNIAAACSGITVAINAIAAGVEAGKVSKADGLVALGIARPTVSFCQPKPAAHLSAADYGVLLGAAADLATRKGNL